jgi:putative ABC transport system permease protein
MFVLKLIIRNVFRHKLRTGLTVLGITIAILAFGLLRTVVDAFYIGVEASSASRLVARNKTSIIFSLPLSYREKIRQVEGVSMVSWGNWFGGIYIDQKNFFANFAVDPESYLRLYPEIVLQPGQKNAFLRDRKGFAAGRKLAERFGWRVGDTVTLKGTIFPGQWDFVLRAIYKGRDRTVDETTFFFHWDYLNENLKRLYPARADQVGFYMIGVARPEIAAETATAVDRVFANSIAETLTETEKAFNLGWIAMAQTIVSAIQLVSFVVIFIIMAVMINTMAMAARERIGEYAVFKTLGYGAFHIAGLIFGESLAISLLGCACGILLTFPAASAFASGLSAYFPVFIVSDKTICLDIAAAISIGLVAGIFPTWRSVGIRIADGLRRIG